MKIDRKTIVRHERDAPFYTEDEAQQNIALDTEEQILFHMLRQNEQPWELSQIRNLEPYHFLHPVHRSIFKIIRETKERGLPCGELSLLQSIRGDDEIIALKDGMKNTNLDTFLNNLITNTSFVPLKDLSTATSNRYYTMQLGNYLRASADEVEKGGDLNIDDTIQNTRIYLGYLSPKFYKEKNARCSGASLIMDSLAKYERLALGEEQSNGLPSGFKSLDNIIDRIAPKTLTIIGARPSTGKTSFAVAMAINLLRSLKKEEAQTEDEDEKDKQYGVVFYSAEVSAEVLGQQFTANHCKINSRALKDGKHYECGGHKRDMYESEKKDIRSTIENMDMSIFTNLEVNDTTGIHIDDLVADLRRKSGARVVFVDYLQLLTSNIKDNPVTAIAEISCKLKSIASELNISVIALAQIGRFIGSRPSLSNLKGSGNIEQDADIVILLHDAHKELKSSEIKKSETLEERQAELDKLEGLVEVIVAKNRVGGVGSTNLMYQKEYSRFKDIEVQ